MTMRPGGQEGMEVRILLLLKGERESQYDKWLSHFKICAII
jgi:hypothetical protein